MTKTTETTYLAFILIEPCAAVWATAETENKALARCKRELKDAAERVGGLKPSVVLDVHVFEIPAGQYWWCSPNVNHYAVDYDTDVAQAHAKLTTVYKWTPNGDHTEHDADAAFALTQKIDAANANFTTFEVPTE